MFCTKLWENVANFIFLFKNYLMFTFILHMGITFSKEKKNKIFLLFISQLFKFISERHCFWSLGNKGMADCFHACYYYCGNLLFHPFKNWINNWTNLKSLTTWDSYKHLKIAYCLIYLVCNSITSIVQYRTQNIVK